MFQSEVVEKVKTHILCLITFLKNCAIYEMWKNIEEPERPHMTIWHIHISHCVPKATDRHFWNIYH
jgi:hypothetical protein